MQTMRHSNETGSLLTAEKLERDGDLSGKAPQIEQRKEPRKALTPKPASRAGAELRKNQNPDTQPDPYPDLLKVDAAAILRPDQRYQAPGEMSREEVAGILASKTVSPSLLGGFACMAEGLLVLITGLLMLSFAGSDSGNQLVQVFVVITMTAFYIVCAQALHLYLVGIIRDMPQQLMRLVVSWMLVFGALVLCATMFPAISLYDPAWTTPWFATGFIGLLVVRLGLTALVRNWTSAGLIERRAVIVGGGREAEELIQNLERQPNNDIRICGIFDDRTDARSPGVVAGYPKLGTVPELLEFARAARLDMLIVSLPLTAGGRVRAMLKKLWVLPVDIRLSAHTNKMGFKQRSYSYIGAMPFLKLADRPITGWRFVRKRAFDAVVSALLLIVLTPLMLASAIAIKLDSKGPVFFRQKRYGFNNEVIDVWKFRSMYADRCDAEARVVVTKGDPRVTRVGAFIRKTSIDELPQLWNVLKGELSLVGPRPHAVHAHLKDQPWNEVVDGYYARHRVKPGVTGWAQINGWRGEVDNLEKIKKRTDYDLYYIENWSLAFDLYILVMTPFRLFDMKNAY